jgi:hypothetical protein
MFIGLYEGGGSMWPAPTEWSGRKVSAASVVGPAGHAVGAGTEISGAGGQ